MMRSFWPLGIVLACLWSSAQASAQSITHRDVPLGQVTGLDMAVEGSLTATPGGKLRWFVTVYEIVKGRDIRPAPGTKLSALASFHRQAPVAEATSDERGRASLIFDIPDTLDEGFHLVVEARSPRGVKRSFDVVVELGARFQTELFIDRTKVPPGGRLHAWGRVLDLVSHRPSANHLLHLKSSIGGLLIDREHELHTDAQGVFHAQLHAPESTGDFVVEANGENASGVVRRVSAELPIVPQLIVSAHPDQAVVTPGSTVMVEVAVRTPDGRPVPRATLSGLSIPVPKNKDDKVKAVLTDAHGLAHVPWQVRSTAELAEVKAEIHALREGIGTGSKTVQVRAARAPVIFSWSAEGGALIPGLPSRVFVQAFHPDGRPWAGAPTHLESARLGATPSTTDNNGVAMFDATVANVDAGAPPSCRGPTVAALTVHVGAHSKLLCLPVDPDASMRVRSAPRMVPGTELAIELFAGPGVAQAPVAVTILARKAEGAWFPVSQTVVAGTTKKLSLPVPAEIRGMLQVRARPMIGATLQEVRGGTTMVWAEPQPDFQLRVTPSADGAMALALASSGKGASTGFVLALPIERGAELLDELGGAQQAWPAPGASDLQWSGFLAAQTPGDIAVSAVLRDGARATLAMPEDSVSMGLLRDPWRTRARFVRGRLGRLMLAVERYVAEHLPDELQDVAVLGPRGWRFNSEILTMLASEMGIDAVAGLDGSPLTIESLQALDANFVYDNVARRLTRERLLAQLVALRQFVQEEKLDYQWARRGDPTTWLSALREWEDPEGEIQIDRASLFDGWGRPFAIRKASGARARFRFLEPIVGYELLSAGPDGKFGNRDDLFDPFARVLPATSLYGEAVGEEELLARLHGVELGRATIAALRDVFELEEPVWETSDASSNTESWQAVARIDESRDVLAAQSVGPMLQSAAAFRLLPSKSTQIELDLSSEPRRYMVVAGAYGADGVAAFDGKTLMAGAPVLIDATLPQRLRPNEALLVPIRITGLGARQELSVSSVGDGAIDVAVLGNKELGLNAGETRTVELRIAATGMGSGQVHVRIAAPDGSIIREISQRVSVMWDGSLRAQHAGALVHKSAELLLKAPADARPIRSFLTVSSPRDLLRDPGFQTLRQEHPEVLAWAHTLRGEPMSKALLSQLSARAPHSGTMAVLGDACAALAWSALPDDKERRSERRAGIAQLQSASAPSSLNERSALLVALASSVSMVGQPDPADPVARLVNELREDGWNAPRTEKGNPTGMARLAAGLLLSDPKDVPGRELFNLARATLVKGEHGGKVLAGRALDEWIGTIALAIAAHQLGEDALTIELVHGLSPRLYLGMGREAEPAFWLLAASVYGVFGVDAAKTVSVTVNGKSQPLVFKGGVATLSLPNQRALVSLTSSQPVLARLEARYLRPIAKTNKASLSATIEGDMGYLGDTAALEATVKNDSIEAVARPVLEIVLPSNARLSPSALQSLAQRAGVDRVETPDAQGLLRIYLAPLPSKQEYRVPLPLRWIGRAEVRGLSVSAFDADRPWLISSTPSRTMKIEKSPKETWQ